jgi:hypothetical protein
MRARPTTDRIALNSSCPLQQSILRICSCHCLVVLLLQVLCKDITKAVLRLPTKLLVQ